jgi:hypothetical protein
MHINDSQTTTLYDFMRIGKERSCFWYFPLTTLIQDSLIKFTTWVTQVFELYIYNSKNSGFFTFPSGEMVVSNLFRSPEHEQEMVTLAALGSSTGGHSYTSRNNAYRGISKVPPTVLHT